ncbi:hypothetical protein RND71_010877 [Anisodus tanguticus]|uniref:Cytochrome P450 n=1 Tax=Anisodus tanguticus TaxID=243964 RepID=A0AAE1SL63_9SOLA|nr:hypothetical protein RND71_010877 [Anisodus tanguticus]
MTPGRSCSYAICCHNVFGSCNNGLELGPKKKLREAREVIDQVIGKYISVKREELRARGENLKEEEEQEGVDLLTSYIDNDDGETKTGLKFDDKFLRDTILNFMIVGRDRTSSGLTWFIWLVVTHPEIEKKIREELKVIIPVGEGENGGPRICLGKEVAFTQMKAVAATIIHNYHVEMVKGHEVYPNVSVILYMKHGFKVRIKRRWEN